MVVVFTFLVLSPWFVRMIYVGLQNPAVQRAGHNLYVTDLFALITPHPYHLLKNVPVINGINRFFTGNMCEKTAYLGIINLLIVSLALYKGVIRKTAKYFCGLFAFLILAMGAYLHVFGNVTSIILPYRIIQAVPSLSLFRVPARNLVYVYLFWAIIVGFSIKYLFEAYKKTKLKKCLLSIMVFLVFLDFSFICRATIRTELPKCYGVIDKTGKPDVILNLPVKAQQVIAPFWYMMYQTFQGSPMVNGIVAREMSYTLVDYLNFEDLKKQKKQLSDNKVKYIVFHKWLFEEASGEEIGRYKKNYVMLYEDESNAVFKVE